MKKCPDCSRELDRMNIVCEYCGKLDKIRVNGGRKEDVAGIIGIINEMKLKQEVTEITYRKDYEDYQLIFGESHHCEIQAKTINDVIVFKNGDAKRHIQFLLNHLTAWQDWEKPGKDPGPGEEGMSIDRDI